MTKDLADGQSRALHARLSEADVRIDGDAGEERHGMTLPARVRREHADHAVSDAVGGVMGGSLGSLDALGKESPEVRAGGVVRASGRDVGSAANRVGLARLTIYIDTRVGAWRKASAATANSSESSAIPPT